MEDHRDLEEDEDDDDLFDEDMDALRRACMITGTNPDDLSASAAAAGESISDEEKLGLGGGDEDDGEEEDDDYDLELVRNIRSRFSIPSEPLLPQPLCFLPPLPGFADEDEAEDDDDFETLRAIQKRFAAYGNDALKNGPDDPSEKQEGHASPVSLEEKTSNGLFFHRVDACKEFFDSEHPARIVHQLGSMEEQPSASIKRNPTDSSKPSTSQPNYSSFPKSAKVFMDAIKKNRSFQKFLRSKLIQIEAKIEENKKLKERVKILKDFQVTCKKRTGRALSQKKDARVQLISMKKAWPSKDLKVHDKKIPAMYYGPQENSHVANYRMALSKFPLSLDHKKWSELEKKNLEKGIRQQFQEMVLQNMVDRLSDSGDSREDFNDLDYLLASVKNLNITPENIREFLPKVNWNQVVSLYVAGRTGAECETRWLNFEDPLINHDVWSAQEDKNLLFIVQNKGINNWFDISVSLGTNRTPFQCLARYQRSLNVSILKREWTKDDDAKLRSAVEVFGECNWQAVASSLEGWTGTQCSNRWKKSLHPTREKVGRWTEGEDKRLTVAQMLFGPKNWKKTAQFVPGRTEVQCRERWVNSLDPSLNWEKWTQEEDFRLREAIAEHGYCWAKVAAALPRRTDNMCRRRWKRLLPHEVPLLQAARRMQKAALICNFVDRESERPAIGPNDFRPLPMLTADEDVNNSMDNKSRRKNSGQKKIKSSCETTKKMRRKKSKGHTQTGSENALEIASHAELDAFERQETTTNQAPGNAVLCIEGQNSSPTLVQMQLGSANKEAIPGFDKKSKKRPRKPHSKREELAESEAKERLDLQTESLNSASNRDITGALVESNAPLAKKRRISLKRKDSRKTRTINSEEPQNIDLSSGNSMLMRSTTRDEHDQEVLSCVDSTLPLGTISEDIGSLGGNNRLVSTKNSDIKRHRKRKMDSEVIGVLQDSVPVPSENNGQNMVKASCASHLVANSGGLDDDTPLSCQLSTTLEKRKPQANDRENDQTCHPSVWKESELLQVDTLDVEKLMPSSTQDEGLRWLDGETCEKTSCNGVEFCFVVDTNEPGKLNLNGETKSVQEVRNETERIDVETGHEANGVSLPSLVEKGSEMKGQNSENGSGGRRPSSLIRGSHLLSKRVNQLHDQDDVSHLTCGPVPEKEPMDNDDDVGNMTLACFLRSKSKKRGLQSSKK